MMQLLSRPFRKTFVKSNILTEGGLVGHLQHLYDNKDLTFGEIKQILTDASTGRLKKVSEKMDGMNLVFTYDVASKGIRVTRGSDIMQGGMNAQALASKFSGRGSVEEAFNSAFRVLEEAINVLDEKTQVTVFGPSANRWYSIEVIYTKNPNVINYDSNNVVFHGWPVFDRSSGEDGEVKVQIVNDDRGGVDILSQNIQVMQNAITDESWRIRGPAVVQLKDLSDKTILARTLSRIDFAMSASGMGDENTMRDYLLVPVRNFLSTIALDPEAEKMVISRAVEDENAPSLTDIKKKLKDNKPAAESVSSFIKECPKIFKQHIAPIELAINDFAVEILDGLKSSLINDSTREVQRLRSEVSKAIDAIETSGEEGKMTILKQQLSKLGSLERITSPMEGVVFIYGGNAYKFTGSFAAANQILGVFKYGRGGTKKMQSESVLKNYIRLLIEDSASKLGSRLSSKEKETREAFTAAKQKYEYLLRQQQNFVNLTVARDTIVRAINDGLSSRVDIENFVKSADPRVPIPDTFSLKEYVKIFFDKVQVNKAIYSQDDYESGAAPPGKKINSDDFWTQKTITEDGKKNLLAWLKEYLVSIDTENFSVSNEYFALKDPSKRKQVREAKEEYESLRYKLSLYSGKEYDYHDIDKPEGASSDDEEEEETEKSKSLQPKINSNPFPWGGGAAYAYQWVSWPKEIENNSGVAFGKGLGGGVGPGEKWLAWTFGGKVMGSKQSWDVEIDDGGRVYKCESKELEGKNSLIRPGTEGLRAYEPAREMLEYAMRQLRELSRSYKENSQLFDEDFASQEPTVQRAFDRVIQFIDNEYTNIVSKGEISVSAFVMLRDALYTVKDLKSRYKSNSKLIPKIKFSGNPNEIEVSRSTFIDVVNVVEKEKKLDVLRDEQKLGLALGILRGKPFDQPDEFLDEFNDAIKLSNVFEQVDGIFIVNQSKGFYWIPAEGEGEEKQAKLEKNLSFHSVSQGKPKFRFTSDSDSSVQIEMLTGRNVPEVMPEEMPKKVPEVMPEVMPEEMPVPPKSMRFNA